METKTPKLPPTVAHYYPDAAPIHPDGMRADRLEIDQLAILVDDIDEAMAFLARAYGWGPFYKAEFDDEAWLRGEMKRCRFRMAFCLVGALEIELLEYVDGECPHREGEPGIYHLRLFTRDMPGELAAAEARGTRVVWGPQHEGRFVGAYLEPNALGFRTELYGG